MRHSNNPHSSSWQTGKKESCLVDIDKYNTKSTLEYMFGLQEWKMSFPEEGEYIMDPWRKLESSLLDLLIHLWILILSCVTTCH